MATAVVTAANVASVLSGGVRRQSAAGRSLFEYADDMAVAVPASCRRSGRCRECVVEIRAGSAALSAPTPREGFLPHGYRLACQAVIARADTDIDFVPLRRRARILLPTSEAVGEIGPPVRVEHGRVSYLGDDLGPVRDGPFGIALDIGTTTVVLDVVDLTTGRTAAVAAFENPQRFGGSDVMTRISYDAHHPGLLRHALQRALNGALRQVYADLEIDRSSVCEVLVVGNPTMRDLFFGLDVSPLGRSPYRSVTEAGPRGGRTTPTWIVRHAQELGVLIHPRGRIVGVPLIASHVGADAVAALAAVDGLAGSTTAMLVDMGTNTEVLIRKGGQLLAASCPAGPAFEGGLVRYGMPAAAGAVESVKIRDGHFECKTIDGEDPVGLCGSGLIDLLAELRRCGQMDATGAFTDGSRELRLAPTALRLSREDVSHLAQAKAANVVGQRILLAALGICADDVERVYLAGAFANAVDIANAIEIGLLVPVDPAKVRRIGNAAASGARILLLSQRRRDALAAVVSRVEHVELEEDPRFFDLFVDGCRFELTDGRLTAHSSP